ILSQEGLNVRRSVNLPDIAEGQNREQSPGLKRVTGVGRRDGSQEIRIYSAGGSFDCPGERTMVMVARRRLAWFRRLSRSWCQHRRFSFHCRHSQYPFLELVSTVLQQYGAFAKIFQKKFLFRLQETLPPLVSIMTHGNIARIMKHRRAKSGPPASLVQSKT